MVNYWDINPDFDFVDFDLLDAVDGVAQERREGIMCHDHYLYYHNLSSCILLFKSTFPFSSKVHAAPASASDCARTESWHKHVKITTAFCQRKAASPSYP